MGAWPPVSPLATPLFAAEGDAGDGMTRGIGSSEKGEMEGRKGGWQGRGIDVPECMTGKFVKSNADNRFTHFVCHHSTLYCTKKHIVQYNAFTYISQVE